MPREWVNTPWAGIALYWRIHLPKIVNVKWQCRVATTISGGVYTSMAPAIKNCWMKKESTTTTKSQLAQTSIQVQDRVERRNQRPLKTPRNGVGLRNGGANGHETELDSEQILSALTALKQGDFNARLPVGWTGIAGKVADTFNELAGMMEHNTDEMNRISRVVGKEGRIQERLPEGQATGAWAQRVKSVNTLIDCLAHPVSETERVIGAVAKGDLSQSMAMEMDGRKLEGDFLRTAKTVNTMVNQLGAFASEVNRVAREVGTEGKLGGQAKVKDVAGTWKDLTDNVNLMASNLTSQVRNIATVTTAVANGDLTKKIRVDVRGEFLELKDTINKMVDQLRSFASEVTRVAREVGT